MNRALRAVLSLCTVIGICAALGAPAHAAGVNDFTVQDYQIDYYLGQDNAGRSTLKTVEAINAVFPGLNQNHGIERAIPASYQGHSTSLHVTSVTDGNNASQHYTTYSQNGNTVVRIGDADTYIHGPHTYKITYTQRDTTQYFADSGRDEFYWDTNGTGWLVPITSLTVRLHIAKQTAAALTHTQRCYQGRAGSTDECAITATNDGYAVHAGPLNPSENATMAVGFKPHTFTPYQKTLAEDLFTVWAVSLAVTTPVAIFLAVWFITRYRRRSYRSAEVTTIVPEYLPPKDTSVSTAGLISDTSPRSFSAQLVDFAVRHYIKIYQTREKSLFKPATYELEIIKDISGLKAEEQEILRAMFGDPRVGARLDMSILKRSATFRTTLYSVQQRLSKKISGVYALRGHDSIQSAWFKRAAGFAAIAGMLTLSPGLLAVALLALISALTLKPFTDTGVDLFRYLKGLKLYIGTAETARLQMLQSPDGAEKIGAPVDTNNTRQLIKLYERVLPYAILFGQEKEWNNRLGNYYQTANEQPTWFAGNNAVFNAAVFSSALSGFSTAAAYSSASSSSSGGSSGGGSSGGGGGGGGGGGW